MASPEIRIGNENKLIPHDVKVGIACTYILGEGLVKALTPIVREGGTRIVFRLEQNHRLKKAARHKRARGA